MKSAPVFAVMAYWLGITVGALAVSGVLGDAGPIVTYTATALGSLLIGFMVMFVSEAA
jgi:hypothetical protein